MQEVLILLPPTDWFALWFFLVSWITYSWLADHTGQGTKTLLAATNLYRLQWMREMLKRDTRTMDSIMVGNLLRSISFFANTSIFILIGLISMLSYQEKARDVLNHIPFVHPSNGFAWEVKILLLICIFVYAFFKYTWSLRQYNYAGIFVCACPPSKETDVDFEALAQKGMAIISSAARHFNNGLRAYYFGLAALAWFIHPYAFMAATAFVILVTHRREFRSRTFSVLVKGVTPTP